MSISRIVVEPTASYVDLFEALSPHNRLDEIEYRVADGYKDSLERQLASKRIIEIMNTWDTRKSIYFPLNAIPPAITVARRIRCTRLIPETYISMFNALATAPWLEEIDIDASHATGSIMKAIAANTKISKVTLTGDVGLTAFALGPPAPHVRFLKIDGGPTTSADLRPHLQELDMPALDSNLLDFLDKAHTLEKLVLRECSGLHLDVVRAWYRSSISSLRVVCFETTGLICASVEKIWSTREFKLNIVIVLTRSRDGDRVLARRIAEFGA